MKIVTSSQMRELEQGAETRGVSTDRLMQNAGLAVAQRARNTLGEVRGEHVTIIIGPGNNGGDGLVTARHLTHWGARVHVYLCARRKEGDPLLEELRDLVVDIGEVAEAGENAAYVRALAMSSLVLDAVLGTGRSRPLEGAPRIALTLVQEAKQRRPQLRLLALDVPSGLDADTGAADPATPSADVTVTLGFPKVGLFTFPGVAMVGRLEIADIGIPEDLGQDVPLELATPELVRTLLPERPPGANKGTFGRVMVVAGSSQYIGAAYLACSGAIRAGAGLVTLATPRSLVPIIAAQVPEVTYLPLQESEWGVPEGTMSANSIIEAIQGYDALLIGCGLGQAPATAKMLRHVLKALPPDLEHRVVVDADGLNILAKTSNWWKEVPRDAVITPHPGEMSRLSGSSVEEIQGDRIASARDGASRWGKTVLLKGAYSVAAGTQGQVLLNPFANAVLATAGTGDVLAGMLASLLGQGLNPLDATAAAAYLHGAAGELVRERLGDAGATASDLLPCIPSAIRNLRSA